MQNNKQDNKQNNKQSNKQYRMMLWCTARLYMDVDIARNIREVKISFKLLCLLDRNPPGSVAVDVLANRRQISSVGNAAIMPRRISVIPVIIG